MIAVRGHFYQILNNRFHSVLNEVIRKALGGHHLQTALSWILDNYSATDLLFKIKESENS
ncbi:hypothetical protein GCM10010946_27640 [Undibacterium squillarum]|uniref:Uncharacterized protein n=1 Tax=Undibacterium squillarum TaxID=1131567 RepID=A0ABQ2Y009_9BURK|nr:hypothetical protein GCM10010946_27640 [Undibacterium squillarum]